MHALGQRAKVQSKVGGTCSRVCRTMSGSPRSGGAALATARSQKKRVIKAPLGCACWVVYVMAVLYVVAVCMPSQEYEVSAHIVEQLQEHGIEVM